jgi:EAL domain-containing protein (putative c-di-GMP-specific phosphodiesterase class I)
VINLARALGLSVVAEGIETEEQRRILRSLGCTLAQGFLFSKPLTAADFLDRIRVNV